MQRSRYVLRTQHSQGSSDIHTSVHVYMPSHPCIHLMIHIYRCMCRFIHMDRHTPHLPHTHLHTHFHTPLISTHLHIHFHAPPTHLHIPPHTTLYPFMPGQPHRYCNTWLLDIAVCTDRHMHMFAHRPAHQEAELNIPYPYPQLNMEMTHT